MSGGKKEGTAYGQNERGYSTLPSENKAHLTMRIKVEGVIDDVESNAVLARVEASEKSVRAVCEEFLRHVITLRLQDMDLDGIVTNRLERRVKQACEAAVVNVERSGALQRAVREMMEEQVKAHVADAYDIVTEVSIRRKVEQQ